jgi:hypothetical protein
MVIGRLISLTILPIGIAPIVTDWLVWTRARNAWDTYLPPWITGIPLVKSQFWQVRGLSSMTTQRGNRLVTGP